MFSQELIHAWQISSKLHKFGQPVSEEELRDAETIMGYKIPEPLREFYRFSNGAYLLRGNLSIFPLIASVTNRGLTTATQQLREWQWPIPDEILVFGDDGSDSLFGIWIPATHNPIYQHPILEIGEIFEPQCMAIVGTGLLSFLLGRTAFYLMVYGAGLSALDAIDLPESLRVPEDEQDSELFARLYHWADPDLPSYHPDPYKQGYDAESLTRIFNQKDAV
jgi:SMI1 / KNR4 family (SUKH-1)